MPAGAYAPRPQQCIAGEWIPNGGVDRFRGNYSASRKAASDSPALISRHAGCAAVLQKDANVLAMLSQPAINGAVVIGITGGVATGKSAFCESLRQLLRGTFFDADRAAHDLSHNDPEVREMIAREFGAEIYSAAGELKRARLRAIVFDDKEKKLTLERILHPRIRQQWAEQAAKSRKSGELFLADIPLLYETGGETLCDRVVVVACSARTQLERLTARTRLDATLARQMIEAQMPLTEKIRRADHLVWNNDGRSSLEAQAAILACFWEQ